MLKKLLAGATTALLALGLVSLVAAPASAHTGDLAVTAVCNTTTGNYDFTAKLTIANTQLNGSTLYKVGTPTFEHTPKQSDPAFSGSPIISTNNPSTITLTTFSLPGTTTGLGPWVYAQTTFTDNYFVGSDGQLLSSLKGDCGKVAPNPSSPTVTDAVCTTPGQSAGSYSIPTGFDSTVSWSVSDNQNNGYVAVTGSNPHAHAAGTFYVKAVPKSPYVKFADGTTSKVFTLKIKAANGDCIVNAVPADASYAQPVCTAAQTLGKGTVTIPSGVTGVVYSISTNNGGSFTSVAQGTQLQYAVGTSVIVRAGPDTGYKLTSTDPGKGYKTYAKVTFTGDASKCVVTSAPAFTDSVCVAGSAGQSTQASYTIPTTTGVDYYVNGVKVDGGKVNVNSFPTSITVTAVPKAGYSFPSNTTASWPTFTFNGPGDCRAPATATAGSTLSICTGPGTSTDPSFTLGNDTHVTYVVKINGVISSKNVPGSTYTVGKNDTVTIDATANSGYKLTPDAPFHQEFSFTGKACLVDAGVSTQPGFSQTACIAAVPGGITPASYTLYAADHISYEVSTDNVTFTPKAVGTWDLDPGQHIWIHAIADQNYVLVGQGAWDYTSSDLGNTCDHDATPATAAWVDAVCHDVRPGHTHATYTVIAAEGVHYKVSTDSGATWTDATPGDVVNVAPDAVVWVQPFADSGYQLTDSSTIKHEFVDPGACEKTVDYIQPTATDATCTEGDTTSGSYTLADVKHVTYDVRVNGVLTKDVAPGTYDANPGDHVKVISHTDKGWNFGNGVYVEKWKFHFVSDGLCTTTPVKPAVTDQTCTVAQDKSGVYTNGTVDIPSTAGVQYTLDGANVATGPHPVTPGDHTVAAIALSGYKLDASYTGPWTLTSHLAPICGDLPSHPLVTPLVGDPKGCAPTGTFTLGNDLGDADAVIWTINGQPAAAGSHPLAAGTSVHVHAEANAPDFGFAQGQQQDWTLTFSAAVVCGDLKTLALTGVSLPTGLIGGGALLLVAGLSLLSVQSLRRRRGGM